MDDLISRQAAKDTINRHFEVVTSELGNDSEVKKVYKMACNHVIDVISILPTIQPEQKTGRWENDKDCIPRCSCCSYIPEYNSHIDDYYYSDFCPNCGAKMESEETK